MNYKVKLEIFEGPLDLLLYLIKKNELNIYDIPISRVTEQYLEYIDMMQILDLDIAGEFLLMAATLIQIKSKMLLPIEQLEEEEQEDPRAELVKKLLEYKKFKEAADGLQQMEFAQKDIFTRPIRIKDIEDLPDAEPVDEASIFDLLSAFSKVLKSVSKESVYEVKKEELTVSGKIHELFHMLVKSNFVRFFDLFKQAKSKIEIVVTFMAVLELIKMKEVVARQDNVFGDIKIMKNAERIIPPKLERAKDVPGK
ncbi:MAG: segregation/condensation protein A [Candidatus Omnitrophota bacterium]